MSAIAAVSTPEECAEQLIQAVLQQDVLAVLYYASQDPGAGIDRPGKEGRSALVTAVVATPTHLSLLIVALLLRLGSSPAAGNPSATEVAQQLQNEDARMLIGGKGKESEECCLADTTAELLCAMSLTDAEGWILEHLSPRSEPSSPSRASADSPRVTSSERPFCLPERPNPPPRERVPPAMQPSNPPSRLGNPSRRFSTLKVTNLPRSITEAGFAAIYYWCDGFIDADLVGGRGYVKFESEQDARAALRAKKGTLVYGRPIEHSLLPTRVAKRYISPPSLARRSRSRSPPPRPRSPPPRSLALPFSSTPSLVTSGPILPYVNRPAHCPTLVLRNIPKSLGASTISDILKSAIRSSFDPFKINFNNITPYAFIDFSDPADVPRAISALHGRRFGGQTLVAEAAQVGRNDPWRISWPQLPAYIRTAEDLQRFVESVGARDAWGHSVHTSLGALNGHHGSTTHFGFSNMGSEREMHAVIEKSRSRGVVARVFQQVAEQTRRAKARDWRSEGGWRGRDDWSMMEGYRSSGKVNVWEYSDGIYGEEGDRARRKSWEAVERRVERASDGRPARDPEGRITTKEMDGFFQTHRSPSLPPSYRSQPSSFSSASARSSFAQDPSRPSRSSQRWLA